MPCTREERLVAFAIVDYVFVTYHFAAQHFGALSLYRARIRGHSRSRTKIRDRLFTLGVGGVLVFLADIRAGAVAYQDRWVDRWSILPWFVSADDEIRATAMLALVFATAAMLLAELRAPRSLPRALYILGVATMVGLALCPRPFPLSRDLDVAALDSGDGPRFAGGGCRAGSGARRRTPLLPLAECATLGRCAHSHVVVGRAVAPV